MAGGNIFRERWNPVDDRFTPGNFGGGLGVSDGEAERIAQRMQAQREAQATRQSALQAAQDEYAKDPNAPNAQAKYQHAARQANAAYVQALPGGRSTQQPPPVEQTNQTTQQAAAPAEEQPTTISGPGGFQARRTQNQDGTYTLTSGNPNEAGSGSVTYSRMREPGSNFGYAQRREAMREQAGGNYGYDPAEARQVQATPAYQQIAPGAYQGGGYTFQGSGADAARFFQPVHPSAHTPQANNSTFLKYRQQELAEEAARRAQAQMPEAPEGGWQTKLNTYRAQMDAYNQELNRQNALAVARIGNEQQAQRLGLDQQRLGFDQEQARQAMDLQRAQLGLQADQNIVNRAKTLADMEQAAVGTQLQQIQLGAQQEYLRALQSGDPAAIARAEAALQALNPKGRGRGGAKDAGGTKVQNLKIGEEEIPFSVDNNGNATLVMPEVMEFYAQNRDKFPESVQGQPLYHQLGRMMPGYREWKVRQEEEAAKAKK